MLDLRELTFMDSTGLRALAQANVKAGDAGVSLSIWRGPRGIEGAVSRSRGSGRCCRSSTRRPSRAPRDFERGAAAGPIAV